MEEVCDFEHGQTAGGTGRAHRLSGPVRCSARRAAELCLNSAKPSHFTSLPDFTPTLTSRKHEQSLPNSSVAQKRRRRAIGWNSSRASVLKVDVNSHPPPPTRKAIFDTLFSSAPHTTTPSTRTKQARCVSQPSWPSSSRSPC